jgi:hypothetical protein
VHFQHAEPFVALHFTIFIQYRFGIGGVRTAVETTTSTSTSTTSTTASATGGTRATSAHPTVRRRPGLLFTPKTSFPHFQHTIINMENA